MHALRRLTKLKRHHHLGAFWLHFCFFNTGTLQKSKLDRFPFIKNSKKQHFIGGIFWDIPGEHSYQNIIRSFNHSLSLQASRWMGGASASINSVECWDAFSPCPCHPCMSYLPTFGQFWGVNVSNYTIHWASSPWFNPATHQHSQTPRQTQVRTNDGT